MKNKKFEIRKSILMLVLFVSSAARIFAQTTVTGTVTDGETGDALPGVNVVVQGTTIGTVTDIDGKYSIGVASDGTLSFSYIGYLPEEVPVNGQQVIDITLLPDLKALEEVVVVGYGVMKRSDLTGAVASIKQEDIEANKTANALHAMQGKVSGLDITQSTGQAGSGINITLRGNRSINANNDPLILVDGLEYGTNMDVNQSDIESMEVLKDASSTAIYGTRGANGVILITTKKGAPGRTNVTFNSYVSYNMPTFIPDIQNADEFIQKRVEEILASDEQTAYKAIDASYDETTRQVTWNQATNPEPWSVFGTVALEQKMQDAGVENAYELVSTDPTFLALADSGVYLDYLDMIFRNSITDNYEFGITSGKEKTSINFSLGLMNDRGLLENDNLRRYNVRFGINQQLNSAINIGTSFLITHKDHHKRDGRIFNQALKTGPIGTLKNPDGSYTDYPDGIFTYAQPNPMLDEAEGAYLNQIVSDRIFGNTYLSIDLLKNLKFKSNLGLNLNYIKAGKYDGPKSLGRIATQSAYTEITNTSKWSYTWENTLNYTKAIGVHEFQGLLGTSTIASEAQEYGFIGTNQRISSTEYFDWSEFGGTIAARSDENYKPYEATQLVSFFGRVNYKFNEQFLLQATLRADGSSVLSPGKKWGYFPSASAGYRLSELDFLKGNTTLNNLKLRASWGISGSAAVPPYQTITGLYPLQQIFYSYDDGSVYSTYAPFRIGNKNLRWETTETWDIGLDFGLYNNRITGYLDYYIANTTDLLYNKPLPPSSVYTQVLDNIATTQNKGLEVFINTINVSNSDFNWSTDWTFSMNRNKIVSLKKGTDEEVYDNYKIYKVGEPVQAFYDYEYAGIYQVEDLKAEYEYVAAQQAGGDSIDRAQIPMISNGYLPGDIKLTDVNNDGVFNDEDKVVYSRVPKFTFGLSNNLSYKNWRLSVLMLGRVGQTLRYGLHTAYKSADLRVENGPYVDSWTPENTGAMFPRYYPGGTGNNAPITSLYYLDGSYVKIKDITLGYTLPQSVSNLVKINAISFYVTGKNLFTFSKIDNYDSEVDGSLNFPLAKQYIAGLNITF